MPDTPLGPGEHPYSSGWLAEDRGHSTPCWIWQGSVSPTGYCLLSWGGKIQLAHRAFYKHHVGPIPDGLVIDHLCRVRSCCNPDHLEAVTQLENNNRGLRGRLYEYPTHCRHGHEYTPENTYWYRGHRQCRECRKYHHKNQRKRMT